MSEQLFTCPACQRSGFTARGLKAHECRELGRRLTGRECLAIAGHGPASDLPARGTDAPQVVPTPLVNFAVGVAPAPAPEFSREDREGRDVEPPPFVPVAPFARQPLPSMEPTSETTPASPIVLRQPAELPDHPLLAHIPVWAPTEPEFQNLKASIIARGVDYPVKLDSQGRVVDGRNRRNACRAAGLPVPTQTIPDDQVVALSLDSLGARRHVSKGAMAYLLGPLLQPAVEEARARQAAARFGADSGSPLSGRPAAVTVESLAAGYGFGRTLLFQALELHEKFKGKPELRTQFEEKVVNGEYGLGAALQAIAGKLATEDKPRVVAPPEKLLSRVVTDLRNRFGAWKEMPEAKRHEVTAEFVAAASEWPADLAIAQAKAWRAAGLIS